MNCQAGYDLAEKIKRKCDGCRKAEEYAQCLGIEVFHYDLANLKAMYSSADRHRTIFLNTRLSYAAREFCTFHEIGHDQIPEHRKMARSSCMREIKFFGEDYMRNWTEHEANIIAAHLYIDEEELKEYLLVERRTIWEAASLLRAPTDLAIIKVQEMERAHRFKGKLDLFADPCFLKNLELENDEFADF